jgi:hypothetical protein
MRRLALVLAVIALMLLVLPSAPSTAIAPNRAGWWYKLNQGPFSGFGLGAPPPPQAPQEGLFIANDNDRAQGPLAIAAVEFIVQVGGDATLTLKAGENSSFSRAAIAACPATGPWSQAFAGKWDQKPTPNCTAGKVLGTASSDGAQMTWKLTTKLLVNPTTYNVVLLPDPDNFVPFAVGIKRPDEDALSAPQAPSEQPSGFRAPATAPAVAAVRAGGYSTLPSEPILPGPVAGLPPPPEAAARPAVPRVARTIPIDDRTERLAASAMLALIAVGLWTFAMRRKPAAVLAGGIGRFARPRQAIPTRL